MPGSHGNYLEFVLNKAMFGDKILQKHSFDSLGTSHNKRNKNYENYKFFCSRHSFNDGPPPDYKNIISINVANDDLLLFTTVAFLRAGNGNVSDIGLEQDTFFKLTNSFYSDLIPNLRKSYSHSSIESYNAIKAEDWPGIESVNDFFTLPNYIQKECIEEFGFKIHPLTEQYPNLDKSYLREFFKHGFKDPAVNGILEFKNKLVYSPDQKVYTIPFASFYNWDAFVTEIESIKKFFNVDLPHNIIELHDEFLKRQFHRTYKKQCDEIVNLIIQRKSAIIPELSLFRESYINAQIELQTGKILPLGRNEYFKTTDEFIKVLDEI